MMELEALKCDISSSEWSGASGGAGVTGKLTGFGLFVKLVAFLTPNRFLSTFEGACLGSNDLLNVGVYFLPTNMLEIRLSLLHTWWLSDSRALEISDFFFFSGYYNFKFVDDS